MPTITVEWLRSVNACDGQVKLFEATFGPSAELNAESLAKAPRRRSPKSRVLEKGQ